MVSIINNGAMNLPFLQRGKAPKGEHGDKYANPRPFQWSWWQNYKESG